MRVQQRIETAAKPLVIFLTSLCAVGTIAATFIILVRVPALAGTRLEMLFGTLLGAAVALLFIVTALMVNLTAMVYRATRPSPLPAVGEVRMGAGQLGPIG